jgi:hypothetical protein
MVWFLPSCHLLTHTGGHDCMLALLLPNKLISLRVPTSTGLPWMGRGCNRCTKLAPNVPWAAVPPPWINAHTLLSFRSSSYNKCSALATGRPLPFGITGPGKHSWSQDQVWIHPHYHLSGIFQVAGNSINCISLKAGASASFIALAVLIWVSSKL